MKVVLLWLVTMPMTRWWACAAAGGGESRDLRQLYSDNPLLQDHSRQSNASLYSAQDYTDLDSKFILQSSRHVKHRNSCLSDDNHVLYRGPLQAVQ